MRKLLQLLAIIAFITGIVSCQKEFEIQGLPATNTSPTTPDSSSTPGNNNGSNSTGNYQPLTKDSYWKYKDSASGTIYTQTATAVTRTIEGRNFTAFKSTNGGADTVYFSTDSHNYYMYAAVSSANSSGAFLMHYLNDTVPVGKGWEYVAGEGNGLQATVTATVIEKGISLVVNNVNYTNVIHTNLVFSYEMLGPISNYDIYVAKDIGIIKLQTKGVGLTAGVEITSYLTEYKIK